MKNFEIILYVIAMFLLSQLFLFLYLINMKDAIVKAVVELARVAVLAVIPVLVLSLEAGSVDWRSIGVVAAIAVLRALDKLLHKYGESTSNDTLAGGLTRF